MKYFPLTGAEVRRRLEAGDRSDELREQVVFGMIDHVERQLAAGYRVSYKEPENYGKTIILEYPDGHRELAGVDEEGNEYHIRDIPSKKRPHHKL